MVFNQHHELWIGNKVYKYVSQNIVGVAKSVNVDSITDMRSVGGILRDSVAYFNDISYDTVQVGAGPRGTCKLMLDANFDQTNGNLLLETKRIDMDGNEITGFCVGTLTINWGDGTSDVYPNFIKNTSHNYSIGTNVCNNYNITATFTIDQAGCGNICSGTISKTITERFCNPLTCIYGTAKDREVWTTTFVVGSTTYRTKGFITYHTSAGLFHNRKVKAYLEYEEKGGIFNSFRKRKPGHRLRVKMHGNVYKSCGGTVRPVDEDEDDRTKKLKVRDRIGESWTGVPSNNLFVDFEAYESNNTTPDVSIYNVAFF